MKTCYIIAGGDFDGFFDQINEEDMVIAADKGHLYAKEAGITPTMIIGDFDSANQPEGDLVIKLNPIKDYTDTKAALMVAEDWGYDEIIIYGGLGGRESHTFANITNALEFKKKGINVVLKSKYKSFHIVDDKLDYKIKDSEDFYVSIFALSDIVKGVDIKGLYYELNNFDLTNDNALGVSNETCGKDFKIKVESGYLLVIFEDKSI
ncbi:thiamine diphosphokinase [Anaerococcus sp. Marseille-Q5996]|uniref:thiamine diphosphokinase n=1 Tax=Anaerococcus sp. Marseille-Q5996 TaxID=2972769 RepID=UPI0021C585DA|nr:thiamine diphosphokinase [Anaerococcus sp. Marseille-Q5996]